MPLVYYKFRDWNQEFHKRILTENEVYFSKPEQLNDPFDCNISMDFSLVKTEAEVSELFDHFIRLGSVENTDLAESKMAAIKDPPSFLKWAQEIHLKNHNEVFGIFSGSMDWSIPPMWCHYSAAYTGFCIGFWKTHFHPSVSTTESWYGPIEYVKELPLLTPLDIYRRLPSDDKFFEMRSALCKTEHWKYENEFRMFKKLAQDQPRLYKLHDSAMAEIILGSRMDKTQREEIIKIAIGKGMTIYQLVETPRNFDRHLISQGNEYHSPK